MDLDTGFAPPASGKGGGKSISSPSRGRLYSGELSGPGQSYADAAPPWSPGSNAGIPTLDQYQELPPTPGEVGRKAPVVKVGRGHAAAAIAEDVSDPSPRGIGEEADKGAAFHSSPTASEKEKAKKDGCAVM